MVTKPKNTNTRAFTLVELLVVISIIALLLSILMPSLQKAREQAKTVICSSNIRQYSLAMGMYLIDNGDAFPHPLVCLYTRDSFSNDHPASCRWHDAGIEPDGPFWPYMASMEAHVCPTFRGIAKREGKGSWHVTTYPYHVDSIPVIPTISYVMNGYLGAGDDVEDLMLTRPAYRMPKVSDVKRPSDTLFMTEENSWPINIYYGKGDCDGRNWSTAGLNDMFFYRADPKTGSLGDCIATFHKASSRDLNSGKGNVVFIDGHVELRHASESFYLSVGKSPRSR